MSAPPSDYFIKASQFTKQVHRAAYPAIDPTLPQLSQAGKIVIITGASQGLGREGFVPAFAKAGAKGIVLVARNATALTAVAKEIHAINSSIQVLEVATDITEKESVDEMFKKVKSTFGTADVLVNNSGAMGELGKIHEISDKTWWRDFEVNVKGTFLITRGFLNLIGTERKATIVNVSTAAALGVYPGVSAYSISKLAMLRLGEYVTVENPNVTAISIHPGIMKTALVPETSPFWAFSDDEPSLAGCLAVWLTTKEAKFLNGRYVNASWDVDDLVAKKDEIVEKGELVFVLQGKFGSTQFE